MSSTIPKVAAGELITAQFMNKVIEACNDLERRVSELEGAGTVVVTEISPVGSLRMGTEVQVSGRNFGLASQVTVSLDGTRAVLKAGSGDRLLVFDVPVIGGVEDAGVELTLRIEATAGTATETVHVLPPLPLPRGDVLVKVTMPSVPKLEANATYEFVCSVQVKSTENETFTLSAAAGAGQQQWVTAVTDSNKAPLSELFFPKSEVGTTRTVSVWVTIPQGATGAARMSLTGTSKRNAKEFFGGSGDVPFTIGAEPPAEPTFPLTVIVYDMGTGEVLSPSTADGKLHLKAGTNYFLEITPTVPQAGTYTISAKALAREDLWVMTRSFGATFPMSAPGPRTLEATLLPATGAPATSLEVRAELQGNADQFGLYSQSITLG